MSKIACIGNSTKDYLVHTKNENPIIIDGRNDLTDETVSIGGPANNAAYVINKFGNETHLIGQIGDDEYGEYISREMQKEGINISRLYICPGLITPHSTIILSQNKKRTDKERTIFTCRDSQDTEIHTSFNFDLNQYDAIHTDGKYLKETLQLFRANPKAKKIIDAGRVNESVISIGKEVDYLICSEDFAINLLKQQGYRVNTDRFDISNFGNCVQLYNWLENTFYNSKLVITIGKNGCIFRNKYDLVELLPTLDKVKVKDVNAAGDIFHGAFVHAITNGLDYREALIYSNITASLSTERVGGRASCPTLDEVNKIFNDHTENSYCTRVLKKMR